MKQIQSRKANSNQMQNLVQNKMHGKRNETPSEKLDQVSSKMLNSVQNKMHGKRNKKPAAILVLAKMMMCFFLLTLFVENIHARKTKLPAITRGKKNTLIEMIEREREKEMMAELEKQQQQQLVKKVFSKKNVLMLMYPQFAPIVDILSRLNKPCSSDYLENKCDKISIEKEKEKEEKEYRTVDVFFIRHGESTWNKGRVKGQTAAVVGYGASVTSYNYYKDAELTEEGEKQAKKTQKYFSEIVGQSYDKFCFFASPLQRAFKTLFIATKNIGIKKKGAIIDPRLKELGNIDCKTPLYKSTGQVNAKYQKTLVKSVFNIKDETAAATDKNINDFIDACKFLPISNENAKGHDAEFFRKMFWNMKSNLGESDKAAIIIGGHSLFIKDHLANVLNKNKETKIFYAKNPEKWKTLTKDKICNGCVLKFTITYTYFDDNNIQVGDPELVFSPLKTN